MQCFSQHAIRRCSYLPFGVLPSFSADVAKGIDKIRLTSKGWGQTKPAADNATDDGKAKNRRVEIVKI